MKQEFRLGERVSTVRFLEQGERAEEIIRREYPHSLIIWVADENTSRYLPAGEPHCLVYLRAKPSRRWKQSFAL